MTFQKIQFFFALLFLPFFLLSQKTSTLDLVFVGPFRTWTGLGTLIVPRRGARLPISTNRPHSAVDHCPCACKHIGRYATLGRSYSVNERGATE